MALKQNPLVLADLPPAVLWFSDATLGGERLLEILNFVICDEKTTTTTKET